MEKNMRAAFSMIPEPAQPHLRGDFWALPGRLEDVPAARCGTGSLLRYVWRERGGKGWTRAASLPGSQGGGTFTVGIKRFSDPLSGLWARWWFGAVYK